MNPYDNIGLRPVDEGDLEKLAMFHENSETNFFLEEQSSFFS